MQQQPGQQPAGGYDSKGIRQKEFEYRGGRLTFFALALYEELVLPLRDSVAEGYQAFMQRPTVQRVMHPRAGTAHSDVLGGLGTVVEPAALYVRDRLAEAVTADFAELSRKGTFERIALPLELRVEPVQETGELAPTDARHHMFPH